MKTQTETMIARPAEDVFAFVADPSNDPTWCPSVKSVRQVHGDGPEEGARYAVVHDPMGKPVDLDYEIVEREPPHRMVLRQDDHLGTFLTTYTLEPVGEQRTRLVQASDMRFKGWAKLAAPVVTLFVRKGNREQFARLKSLLEGDKRADRAGGSR